MAAKLQIQCIKKTNRTNPHERIEGVGGLQGVKRWYLSEAQAIEDIELGKWEFFVRVGALEAKVIVAIRLGRKYLKTVRDGETPDNLLSLPQCP